MQDVLADARMALSAGQQAAAASLLKQIVRTEPNNAEAWYLLGEALTDPAQKAECARRAEALGYVSQPAPAYTGATERLPEQVAIDALNQAGLAPAQSPTLAAPGSVAAQPPDASAGFALPPTNGVPEASMAPSSFAYVMPQNGNLVSGPTVYASFLHRFGAFLIDFVVFYILVYIFNWLITTPIARSLDLTNVTDFERIARVLGFLAVLTFIIYIAVGWFYYALMESSKLQATVGKLVLGVKVTDLNGQRISFLRATGHFWARVLSVVILMLGFLVAAITERKQTLHDLIAGVVVVKK